MVKEGEGKTLDPAYVKWLLEAIGKVKYQKQRPNYDRIVHAVKQNHPKLSPDGIGQQLELAVKQGLVLKVFNKGLCSYKDPALVTQLRTRNLKVSKKTDLTKVIARTIRELGEQGGSNLKSVEKYIERSYNLQCEGDDVDLVRQIRVSCKRALESGRLVRNGRQYSVGVGLRPESEAGTNANGTAGHSSYHDRVPFDHASKKKVNILLYFPN